MFQKIARCVGLEGACPGGWRLNMSHARAAARLSSSANPKHNRGEAGQLVDISVSDANLVESATELSSNHVSRYAGQGVMDNLL
jgi:hypothetical protein